jgi:hypothetical protein
MIDQLKEVYIDGELEMIDTANWLPKVIRKDYTVGFHISRSASAMHQYSIAQWQARLTRKG